MEMIVENKEVVPFKVPVNYNEAQDFHIFEQKYTGLTSNNDTVIHRGVSVSRDSYDEYMRRIREYIKKHDAVSIARDIESTPHSQLKQMAIDEDIAYDEIVHFVDRYVPMMHIEEEVDSEPVIEMIVEERARKDVEYPSSPSDNVDRLSNMPVDILVNVIVSEIDGYKSMDDALSFITRLMHTSLTLMSRVFSAEGEAIWKKMIAKYYAYSFMTIDALDVSFFTESRLGDSPLIAWMPHVFNKKGVTEQESLAEMKKKLKKQINVHKKRLNADINGSEPYLLFMYMLLYRRDTLPLRRMTQIKAPSSVGCYYKHIHIDRNVVNALPVRVTKELHVGTIIDLDILQYWDEGDMTIHINDQEFESNERLTSVIPIAYYATAKYTKVDVCLLLNRKRLLHCVIDWDNLDVDLTWSTPKEVARIKADACDESSNIKWTDFGDISLRYPDIKRCNGFDFSKYTLYKKSVDSKSPKSDPYSYLRAYQVSMQPIAIPNATVGLVDFRQLVANLTKKGKRSPEGVALLPLIRLFDKFKGHVIGSRIVNDYDRLTGTWSFHLVLCSYHKGWLRYYKSAALVVTSSDASQINVTKNGHKVITVTEPNHFIHYDYQLWSLVGVDSTIRFIDADLKLKSFHIDKTSVPFLHTIESIKGEEEGIAFRVDSARRRLEIDMNVETQYKWASNCGDDFSGWSTTKVYRFTVPLDEMRGDVIILARKDGFGETNPMIEEIAEKMDLDYKEHFVKSLLPDPKATESYRGCGGERDYKPGIRALIMGRVNHPIVAYTTKPYSRDEMNYIGLPYCLTCGDTEPLHGLAHESSNLDNVFCRVGQCQKEWHITSSLLVI